METSLMEAGCIMELLNLNTPRDLVSNCRRREKAAAAKHYRDLFSGIEKCGILLRITRNEIA